MQIITLTANASAYLEQTAQLLYDGFREHWPAAWPSLKAARQEVAGALAPSHLNRLAVAEGKVIGWVGGQPQYNGYVWELHPLVVHANFRRQGVGRALVQDLEAQVRHRGGLTLWLGTDDEAGLTSVGGINLYPNVLEHLQHIRNLHSHPYEFYQKLGFVIVGVMPDANGPGKPDILMAKSISPDM